MNSIFANWNGVFKFTHQFCKFFPRFGIPVRILPYLWKQGATKYHFIWNVTCPNNEVFYACSEVIFPSTLTFIVFSREISQGFIQISDITKKYANVHFSLVDYWSHVTKHSCNLSCCHQVTTSFNVCCWSVYHWLNIHGPFQRENLQLLMYQWGTNVIFTL